MRTIVCRLAATAALVFVVNAAAAQDKIRIGLIYTLSGPPSTLGQQSKNGFELALKDLGGKMGGRDVELVVVDDELKPDVAIQKVRGMIEHDHVDFVVGPIFSNILAAIHKPVIDAGKILISSNAGTSNFAGAACNPNFFVTSYQNDQIYEAIGAAANKLGYKRVYALVPNYPAGKDALAGFKRTYKGEIVEESLVPLNTTDFAFDFQHHLVHFVPVVFHPSIDRGLSQHGCPRGPLASHPERPGGCGGNRQSAINPRYRGPYAVLVYDQKEFTPASQKDRARRAVKICREDRRPRRALPQGSGCRGPEPR